MIHQKYCEENYADDGDGKTVRAVAGMEVGGGEKEFKSKRKSVRAVSFGLAVCRSGSCSNATRRTLGKDPRLEGSHGLVVDQCVRTWDFHSSDTDRRNRTYNTMMTSKIKRELTASTERDMVGRSTMARPQYRVQVIDDEPVALTRDV